MKKPKKWDAMTPEDQASWIKNEIERSRKNQRKWRESNLEKANEKSRNWRKYNIEKARATCRKWHRENLAKSKERNRKYRDLNHDIEKERLREWRNQNLEKARNSCRRQSQNLTDAYISGQIGLSVKTIRNYPELIEAKREQIRILRTLKPTRKQQCIRTPITCKKSAITSRKPHTPHGLTSLLSLELSSWSTPWVRQLTLLLSKSKRLS